VGPPIDSRHLAFSSAFIGIAAVGLDSAPQSVAVRPGRARVAAIGFMNLAVSFALALNASLRSRQVSDTVWRAL